MTRRHRLSFQAVHAARIGYQARQTMAETAEASVLGTTSRGLFLQTTGRWIVFLSYYERFCSPLTITLRLPAPALYSVERGDPVIVQRQRLTFPTAKVGVLLPEETWRPPAPSVDLCSSGERVKGLKQMAAAIADAGREQAFGLLLRSLLGLPTEGPLPAEQRSLLDVVVALRGKLEEGDGDGAAAVAGRLLGRGRGLTASGDDFLAGLLLFAHRHPGTVRPALPFPSFSQAVVDAAYQKTTTISANLIECAARGHADERLLAAADCVATGSPAPGKCLPPLLGWGASSGVDALVGMACTAIAETISPET